MILIDFSGVAIANIFAFSSDLKKNLDEQKTVAAINIIRHAVLSSLKMYRKKYGNEYGNLVIACDGRNYWRKEIFQYYKGKRKADRDKSDLDWDMIFKALDELKQDLVNYFPYKVINYDRAEGDDVIGVLTKWAQTNDLVTEGLFTVPQKVLIISADNDFVQLQKYDNVRQWSPQQKKFVTTKSVLAFTREHIVKAGDDGIPNILSPDDVFMRDDLRQTPIKAKLLARFIEKGRDACENETEFRGWDRNQRLIDFDFIPEDVSNAIIDSYVNQVVKGNKSLIMNYLIKHRCRLLLEEIEGF